MIRDRVRRSDRGAFLLIFALSLTVVLIITAMTVDLGKARFSKRDEQQLADLASISAGRQLAGYGATSSGDVVSRPRDACKAAMASIDMNSEQFNPTAAQIDTACDTLPETTVSCDGTTLPSNATVIDDPYAVTVRWPIPDGEITDDRFFGAGTNDGTDQCTRLRIAVQRTDDTAFAGVIGTDTLTTSASAVVRSTLDNDNTIIPAFVILERSRCDALSNSVGGPSQGIQILGIPSTDQPGTIQVDSTANNGCTGSAANSVAVYGTPLSSGQPSINLHPAPSSGAGGLLYVVATANAAKSVPDGINVPPLPAEPVSRTPFDEEFNSLANPAVPALHARARGALDTSVPTDATGDGWKRLGCDLAPLDAADTDTDNWYVRCDSYTGTTGAIDAAATAFGATPGRVVFDGDVDVPNGQSLDFTTAAAGDITEVAVKGKLSAAGDVRFGQRVQGVYVGAERYVANVNQSAVAVSGTMAIRSALLPSLRADGSIAEVCPTAAQAGRAEFVIFGDDAPNLNSSGDMAMCNTVVYPAGNTRFDPFRAQFVDSGGNCTPELPCPKTTGNVADAGRFEFNGIVDWTAPNETSGPATSPRGVEDLLFWSESSLTSELKAGANAITQGIFVGPNMNVEFRSPAVGSPRNAQFVARRLKLLQGTLYMLPNPNDSTPIPTPGSFAIIR